MSQNAGLRHASDAARPETAYSDEGDHSFRFDPDHRFEAMPITIGAKRRWRMDLDRSDRHPSTNAVGRGGAREGVR